MHSTLVNVALLLALLFGRGAWAQNIKATGAATSNETQAQDVLHLKYRGASSKIAGFQQWEPSGIVKIYHVAKATTTSNLPETPESGGVFETKNISLRIDARSIVLSDESYRSVWREENSLQSYFKKTYFQTSKFADPMSSWMNGYHEIRTYNETTAEKSKQEGWDLTFGESVRQDIYRVGKPDYEDRETAKAKYSSYYYSSDSMRSDTLLKDSHAEWGWNPQGSAMYGITSQSTHLQRPPDPAPIPPLEEENFLGSFGMQGWAGDYQGLDLSIPYTTTEILGDASKYFPEFAEGLVTPYESALLRSNFKLSSFDSGFAGYADVFRKNSVGFARELCWASIDSNSGSASEVEYWFESNDALPHVYPWFVRFTPWDNPLTERHENEDPPQYKMYSYEAGDKHSSPIFKLSPGKEGKVGLYELVYFSPTITSPLADNNGTYDMSKHDVSIYPHPANVVLSDSIKCRENALMIPFRNCVDSDSHLVVRPDTHWELDATMLPPIAGLAWELLEAPPGTDQLQPRGTFLGGTVNNLSRTMRGGIYRYRLRGMGVEGLVWLPLAGPDITEFWEKEIKYYRTDFGPKYRAKVAQIKAFLEVFMSDPHRIRMMVDVSVLEDMRSLGGTLDYHGAPRGKYSPRGGPNVAGNEDRLTMYGVVICYRKRNNMMYALAGREMGISEFNLTFWADPKHKVATGAPDTPAAKESYKAGYDLFRGVDLRTVMITRGAAMQEPNLWSPLEWPSWEKTSEGLDNAKADALKELVKPL